MRRPLALLALLLVAASFFLPQAASALLPAALRAEGFAADPVTATVDAWPPQEVLLGRASRVTVTTGPIDYAPITAGGLTVTIDDIDLLARRTGGVQGTMSDVTVDGSALSDVSVAGPSVADLTFRATVPQETLAAELRRAVGATVTVRALLPPDTVEIALGPLVARPTVDVAPGGRSLRLAAGGLPVTLSVLVLDAAAPVRLRRVSVVSGGLLVEGSVDASALTLRPL